MIVVLGLPKDVMLKVWYNPEFKIRPSLTTSKEGLKRLNIHLETTGI
jgi:hypothetical protein